MTKDSLELAELATKLNEIGKTDEAIECMERATQIDSKNPYAWYGLSMLLLKAGKRSESKDAMEKAFVLSPKKAKDLLQYLNRDR
jgi:tetratricopeptide (TPR) repeat protein